MEIYIIELTKFEKYKDQTQNKFIQNPEVVEMSNKQVKKAKQVLEEISQDEREIYLAELREKYIMDQKAIEGAGYDKGLAAGVEIGRKQGMSQGFKQCIQQIAKKMLSQKIDLETISELTGLTLEELKKL